MLFTLSLRMMLGLFNLFSLKCFKNYFTFSVEKRMIMAKVNCCSVWIEINLPGASDSLFCFVFTSSAPEVLTSFLTEGQSSLWGAQRCGA